MPNTFDIVSIGSAVLDVILKSDQYHPTPVDGELMLCEIYGGKANVQQAHIGSGGAGANTAISFARHGYRAAVVAEVGSDPVSQLIFDDLHREGIVTDFIRSEEGEQTGTSAILVAADGSRSAMTFRGAAYQLTSKDIPFEELKTVTHIHLSSIGNADLIREIFLFCAEHNLSLSWNPSKTEIEEIILRSGRVYEQVCEVLFLNDQEFQAVEQYQEKLLQTAKLVVVTRGKSGGEVWQNGQKHPYKARLVPVMDETGAGDAFASGFVSSWLREHDIDQATQAGVANASSVVGYLGAQEGLLRIQRNG